MKDHTVCVGRQVDALYNPHQTQSAAAAAAASDRYSQTKQVEMSPLTIRLTKPEFNEPCTGECPAIPKRAVRFV